MASILRSEKMIVFLEIIGGVLAACVVAVVWLNLLIAFGKTNEEESE